MEIFNSFKEWKEDRYLGKIEVMERKKKVRGLIRALRSTKYVKAEAAKALGWIGDKRAIKPLIPLLLDSESFVRNGAAFALGKISHGRERDARPVDSLISVLNDHNIEVRYSAARSLGWICDPSAVEALIDKLDDQGEYAYSTVGEMAAESLLEIVKDSDVQIDISIIQKAKDIINKKPAREKQRKKRTDKATKARKHAAMIGDPQLCDKALLYMRRLVEQYYATPSPPYPDKEHDQLVKAIPVICEIAIQKRREGIAAPKEAQVIQEIYRNRLQMSAAAWIVIECEKALEKLGAL